MPEISVIIPTHNRWHLLPRTLVGALEQEDVDHEVVVVDDASRDETAANLARIEDDRLRVVRNERNLGLAGTRNRGLEEARGEWVAFLDDDDLWSPRKLRLQLDAVRETRAIFAYASIIATNDDLDVIDAQYAPDPSDLLDQLLRLQVVPAGGSNVITRTELARRVGGFEPGLKVAEDWDMWIRVMEASDGGRAATCQDFLCAYAQHETSMIVVDRKAFTKALRYIEEEHADLRRRRGQKLDSANLARWLAKNYRRAGDKRAAGRLYLHSAIADRDPGNLLRAAGALAGEAWMRRFARYQPPQVEPLEWLDLYRSGGRFDSLATSLGDDGGA